MCHPKTDYNRNFMLILNQTTEVLKPLKKTNEVFFNCLVHIKFIQGVYKWQRNTILKPQHSSGVGKRTEEITKDVNIVK